MNIELVKQITDTNRWSAIGPELALACLALAVLALHVLVNPGTRRLLPGMAVFGQAVLLIIVIKDLFATEYNGNAYYFGGMICQNLLTDGARVFFLFSSTIMTGLSVWFMGKHRLPKLEYAHLILVVTAALMLLLQSNHFVMLFVALETVTIGFYVMVSYSRKSVFSLEAGVKYLILGALSSGMLLFGIVLLYGTAGTPGFKGASTDPMHYDLLMEFLYNNPGHPMAIAGVLLVVCGVAFKLGVVPFQIWIPDVYQGAPTPTTAFLAVASKAAGFMVLINLVLRPFSGMESLLVSLLSAVAIVTILFGNLAALPQRNVKRVMGMSGIAHAGYLLAGIVAVYKGVDFAVAAVIFYLVTYMIGSYAVFAVMMHVSQKDDAAQDYDEYTDLSVRSPFLSGSLVVGLASLAGVPPLVGFVGKFILFMALYEAELYALLAASIVGVVISIYYYFGWIREAVFRIFKYDDGNNSSDESIQSLPAVKVPQMVIIGLLVFLAVALGFFQGDLGHFIFSEF